MKSTTSCRWVINSAFIVHYQIPCSVEYVIKNRVMLLWNMMSMVPFVSKIQLITMNQTILIWCHGKKESNSVKRKEMEQLNERPSESMCSRISNVELSVSNSNYVTLIWKNMHTSLMKIFPKLPKDFAQVHLTLLDVRVYSRWLLRKWS